MATKKNIIKEEKLEPTTTQLSYSGEVKITVRRGKNTLKTIRKHNAGTEYLFKAILNFLIGYPNVGNAPNFIDALGQNKSQSGESSPGESILIYKSNISSKTLQINAEGKSKAVFTGYISSKQLKTSSNTTSTNKDISTQDGESGGTTTKDEDEEGKIYYLALVDNNNKRLAGIDVTTKTETKEGKIITEPLQIPTGTSIIVEWYMGVDNVTTTTTNQTTKTTV